MSNEIPDVLTKLDRMREEATNRPYRWEIDRYHEALANAYPALSDELRRLQQENEKQRLRHIKEMNYVLGSVNPLMIALGMDWQTKVSHLCNFAGDLEAIREKWRIASGEALDKVTGLQSDNARLRNALRNLIALYDNTDKQSRPGQFIEEARAAIAGEETR